jgi:hypothetical protein
MSPQPRPRQSWRWDPKTGNIDFYDLEMGY